MRFDGVVFGDKVGNLCDFNLVWSRRSKLVALITYGTVKTKKKDYVDGAIYKATEEDIDELV